MTGIVAHTYPEWWLKLTGQVAHWSTDYSLGYKFVSEENVGEGYLKLIFRDPIIQKENLIKIPNVSSTVTGTIPRVFLFKTDLPFDDAEKIGEWIYKSIKKGVLVIPEFVEFIGVEDLFKTERTE